MYVRTWKDTEMVATSDSSTSESASNERPDPTPTETGSDAAPDTTEPPRTSAEPASTPRVEPATDAPKRAASRRNGSGVSRGQVAAAVAGVRERLAAIVWILAVVAAMILAAGALLIALDANPNNDLVHHVVGWAGDLDGPFNNMFTFDGDNAATKEALVNWGLAAVAWLVGGKIVSSIIRP